VLDGAVPLLSALEVQQQHQLVLDGGLAGGRGALGFGKPGHRLAQQLCPLAIGQLLAPLTLQVAGPQDDELPPCHRRAPALGVGRLDAAGEPCARHLDEVAERARRNDLAAIHSLDL
jgi:hypothetical protein